MTYQLYKPLRNNLRQHDLMHSLGVIRAYMQYLQFKQPLPQDVEARLDVLTAPMPQRGIYEWDLELLARELILNASDNSPTDLREWRHFSNALNKVKELENNIAGHTGYRNLYEQNFLLELYRIAHRQFPWQRKPNKDVIIRYFKIFGCRDMDAILRRELGMDARQLYTLGILLTGHFLSNFELEYPFAIRLPGFAAEDLERFIERFAIDIDVLRRKIAEQQSYDQDFTYAMNPLLINPLVRVNLRGRRTVISPVPTYLFRRFTEGVYYEICNATDFPAAFGNAYQQYVGEVFRTITSGTSVAVYEEHQYHDGRERKDSVDWVVTDDTASIFLECKTKKIRYAAKISLTDASVLQEDLDKMASFIVQVYKTISDAQSGLYPHWKPNGRPIYPIVVTLEDWYIFGDAIISEIDNCVREKMRAAGLNLTMLDQLPYSICSVEDMESAAAVMTEIGIETFMRRKHEGEHRLWTYGALMNEYYRDETQRRRRPLFPDAGREIHPEF